MQTDRLASFGVHDQELASQIKHKESRTLKQRKFQEKAEKEREIGSEIVQLADSENSSDDSIPDHILMKQRLWCRIEEEKHFSWQRPLYSISVMITNNSQDCVCYI